MKLAFVWCLYLGGPNDDPPAEIEVDGFGCDELFPLRVTPSATPAPAPPRIARMRIVFPLPLEAFAWAALV